MAGTPLLTPQGGHLAGAKGFCCVGTCLCAWMGRKVPPSLSFFLSFFFFFFNNMHFCFHSEVLWGFALPPRQGLNFQFALGCSSKGCCSWLLMSSLEIKGETGRPAACLKGRAVNLDSTFLL